MSKKVETSGKAPISYDDGILAAQLVSKSVVDKKGMSAVCGGLALHIYGFTRATKDVDMLSDVTVDFKCVRNLNFGGYAYAVDVGGKIIEVDVIIRSDEIKELYEQALFKSKINKALGIRVITPEYLVLLKYLAGRGKDQIDLMWLLREDGLVDREKVKSIVQRNMGKHSYWALRDLDQLFLEADLLRARDARGE